MRKRDRQGEEVKNVRGNPKGNERRRFSHVTTPHVRRQIFTCGPRTKKGNVEATHGTPECGPRLHRETCLFLSLSPLTKVEMHMHTSRYTYTVRRPEFPPLGSMSRSCGHARETLRLLYHSGWTQGSGRRRGNEETAH